MRELLEHLAELDEQHDRWVTIGAASWWDGDCHLELVVRDENSWQIFSRWKVRCFGTEFYKITDVNGGGFAVLDADHPVVSQFTTRKASLFFAAAPEDVHHTIGGLWCAHGKQVHDWIEFDTYTNRESPLESLLASGSGKLASGPDFLIEAYANVLRDHACRPSTVDHGPAKEYVDGQWRPRKSPLAGLHFGSSWIVAREFEVERNDDTQLTWPPS